MGVIQTSPQAHNCQVTPRSSGMESNATVFTGCRLYILRRIVYHMNVMRRLCYDIVVILLSFIIK